MAEPKLNIIYPAYINKNRTVAQGRRIPLESAVEDPKPKEVLDALMSLKGFQATIAEKAYPREPNKEAAGWCIQYSKYTALNKRKILVACAKRMNENRQNSVQGKPKKKK